MKGESPWPIISPILVSPWTCVKAKQHALSLAQTAKENLYAETPPDGFPAELAEHLEGWHFEAEEEQSGIWLHSYEGGVDAACAFIQHLLQKFELTDCITFEWSFDCSKPRTDAYGGGAAVITAHEIKTFSTSAWLQTVTG